MHDDGEVENRVDPEDGHRGTAALARENDVVEVACGNHLCHDCRPCRADNRYDDHGHGPSFGPCHGAEGRLFCGPVVCCRRMTQSRTVPNLTRTRMCPCLSRYPSRNPMTTIPVPVRALPDVAP